MKYKLGLATGIVFALLGNPAVAGDNNGFGVGTSAVTTQYLDNYGTVANSTSAYRMGADSSGNYTRMGDVAPVSFDNCGPTNTGCITATHGGTTALDFDQTRSVSNSGLVYDGGYGPWTVGGSTYADLSTGKIGASGSTDYYQTALTVARFVDTLEFSVAGANASTTTNIVVKFQLDGSLSTPDAHGATGLGTPYGLIDNIFGFGAANGRVTFEQFAANRRYGQEYQILNQSNSQSGWVSYSWDTISPGLTQFTGVYALSGVSQTLGISNYLSGFTTTGGSFAYGNTSSLSFILPTNVTFTSASGVFLSALNQNAVPEPATWAMMLFGFGIVGSAMRRGRRSLALV